MTSEEIAQAREAARDSALGFAEIDKLEFASGALNRFALLEIAYQLAVANERATAMPPNYNYGMPKPSEWEALCLCGHRRVEHGAAGCAIFVDGVLCGCSGFKGPVV